MPPQACRRARESFKSPVVNVAFLHGDLQCGVNLSAEKTVGLTSVSSDSTIQRVHEHNQSYLAQLGIAELESKSTRAGEELNVTYDRKLGRSIA